MKTIIKQAIILSVLTLVSCSKNEPQYSQIFGSWKMRDAVTIGKNMSNKTTYHKDGTVTIDLLSEGKVLEKIMANYSIDKDKGAIRLEFPLGKQKQVEEFSIVKLDKDEFDYIVSKTGKVIRNIRY